LKLLSAGLLVAQEAAVRNGFAAKVLAIFTRVFSCVCVCLCLHSWESISSESAVDDSDDWVFASLTHPRTPMFQSTRKRERRIQHLMYGLLRQLTAAWLQHEQQDRGERDHEKRVEMIRWAWEFEEWVMRGAEH
jgi:hypothetical protein